MKYTSVDNSISSKDQQLLPIGIEGHTYCHKLSNQYCLYIYIYYKHYDLLLYIYREGRVRENE